MTATAALDLLALLRALPSSRFSVELKSGRRQTPRSGVDVSGSLSGPSAGRSAACRPRQREEENRPKIEQVDVLAAKLPA